MSRTTNKNERTNMNIESNFTKTEISDLYDAMEDGGKAEVVFTSRLVQEEDDLLTEISKHDLVSVGFGGREADLFVCAVAASARGNWKTTQNVLYWAKK